MGWGQGERQGLTKAPGHNWEIKLAVGQLKTCCANGLSHLKQDELDKFWFSHTKRVTESIASAMLRLQVDVFKFLRKGSQSAVDCRGNYEAAVQTSSQVCCDYKGLI